MARSDSHDLKKRLLRKLFGLGGDDMAEATTRGVNTETDVRQG